MLIRNEAVFTPSISISTSEHSPFLGIRKELLMPTDGEISRLVDVLGVRERRGSLLDTASRILRSLPGLFCNIL